jgi:hypothetical protein
VRSESSALIKEGWFEVSVHHVVVEVDRDQMVDEIDFWGALGWHRDHQKHRGLQYPGEWLVGYRSDPRLWLRSGLVGYSDGSVTMCLAGEFRTRMSALDRLPWKVPAERLESFWGAEYVVVTSPSGHRVELLERAPAARRYGPPEEAVV